MAPLLLLKTFALHIEPNESRYVQPVRRQLRNASNRDAMLQVFVGVRDPNPLVNNAGVDTLTRAGIDVAYIGGEEERECYDINADFMARMSPT